MTTFLLVLTLIFSLFNTQPTYHHNKHWHYVCTRVDSGARDITPTGFCVWVK